ncbi:MAG: hypothetical protein AB1457_16450 [Chloroflexota bacterium]|nr:MAG: hypothetical protein KatS3mg045_1394 [Bellilinea sp.]
MNETKVTNLDIQCAELGRKLAGLQGMEEKILNAALTVLEEQGPYAMFLYLGARHSAVAEEVEKQSLKFLKGVFNNKPNNTNPKDMLTAISQLAENLDDLLFARDLLRTVLSYARYHLKAKGGIAS